VSCPIRVGHVIPKTIRSMKKPSDSSPDSTPPSQAHAGDSKPPGSQGPIKRRKPKRQDAEVQKASATIQRAERILALGIALENEHLRASEVPRQRALACSDRGDDAGAEAAWREVIAIEEKTGDVPFISKAYLRFGHWLLEVDQYEAAFANSTRLVEVSRQSEFSFVLWTALEQRVYCALRVRLMTPALEAATEALRLAEGCADLKDHCAPARVLRGICMLEFGDIAGAEAELEASREAFRDKPGVKWRADLFPSLIRWWELTARVRMEQQDVSGSTRAWEKVVLLRRALFVHRKECWPRFADALLDWADALRLDGQPDEATAAEAESDRLVAEFDVSSLDIDEG